MSSKANRELIRHIMEDGFNKQNMSVVYDSFHENYVRHGHGVASMGSLTEHVHDLIARHKAFKDAKFTIRKIVADDKSVAIQNDFSGVHRNDFNGVPDSGNKITHPAAAYFTIRNGQVSEGTVFADSGEFLAQLRN